MRFDVRDYDKEKAQQELDKIFRKIKGYDLEEPVKNKQDKKR